MKRSNEFESPDLKLSKTLSSASVGSIMSGDYDDDDMGPLRVFSKGTRVGSPKPGTFFGKFHLPRGTKFVDLRDWSEHEKRVKQLMEQETGGKVLDMNDFPLELPSGALRSAPFFDLMGFPKGSNAIVSYKNGSTAKRELVEDILRDPDRGWEKMFGPGMGGGKKPTGFASRFKAMAPWIGEVKAPQTSTVLFKKIQHAKLLELEEKGYTTHYMTLVQKRGTPVEVWKTKPSEVEMVEDSKSNF